MPDPIQPDPRITIPQPGPKSRLKAPTILIAISVVLIILGFGLCSAGGLRLEEDSIHPVVVGIGTAAFWGGALGFFVGVLWWLIAIVANPRPQGKSQ
jgi:hypothetical protein